MNYIALYADMVNHKLSEDEIKIASYGGALMLLVDDVFDFRNEKEVNKFVRFTLQVLESTRQGGFSTENEFTYFKKHHLNELPSDNYLNRVHINLDRLAFHLYCEIVRLLNKKPQQKNDFIYCLQKIQNVQNLHFLQKINQKTGSEDLEKIYMDKGGYCVLIGGYTIDSDLPSIIKEDLYSYSKISLNKLNEIFTDNNSNNFNNRYFWRRQLFYELGAFVQYVDDKHDIKEDQKLGIVTFASRSGLTREEIAQLKKRIFNLYNLAFKKEMFILKFHFILFYLKIYLSYLETLFEYS